MGPFCVTRSNPTRQLTDQLNPTASEKNWIQPDPNQYNYNGAYSLVVTPISPHH